MIIDDLFFVFQWWAVFLGIGLMFLPLTIKIFPNFFDKGHIFSKILGIVILSYAVFLLGILKILPFTIPTILLVVGFFAGINIFILKKYNKSAVQQLSNETIIGGSRQARTVIKIVILEEFLFLFALLFWSFIRAHQPDIQGLEKFMDFGFINSILRSEYFPPKDMWFTPFPINYYYFGHLATAVLIKLSGISSSIAYNLMLSTIFALTFAGAFSIGVNLTYLFKSQITNHKSQTNWNLFGILSGGFLTALLVSLTGSLHSIYTFFKPYVNENPVPFWNLQFSPLTFPNSYWYPNATRFIYNTIHEFPMYSFVVSDLHGHVLDIPVVLLTIAVLLSLVQNSKLKIFNFSLLTLLAFLLAVMYMTNVWDGIIYFILSALIIFYLERRIYKIIILFLFFLIFSLPFSLHFKPFASGIGILCAPKFLTNIARIGPLLFEADHCQKSPLWQLVIMYGFFYFFVTVFIITLFKKYKLSHLKFIENFKLKIKNLSSADIFILILILFSTLLIIIPEFIYVKDIYPAHYRANTMFKLVYQLFIMLSLSSGYIIIRTVSSINYAVLSINLGKKILTACCILFIIVLLFLVGIYSYLATQSYYDNLTTYHTLDGTLYLKKLYPADYEAIRWINKNIKNQPVLLEAQGDSYTDYARVSANTGLSTILGWLVHEWLWRGTYDIPSPRIEEVKNLYETENINLAKKLIKKYNIELVFVGELERQKYPDLNEKKFEKLGKIVFQKNQTRIYQLK